jgi:hypothetical protein
MYSVLKQRFEIRGFEVCHFYIIFALRSLDLGPSKQRQPKMQPVILSRAQQCHYSALLEATRF